MKKKLSIIFLILFILTTLLYVLNITNKIDIKILNYFISIRSNNITNIMKNISFFGSVKFIIPFLVLLMIIKLKDLKIYILDLLMILEIIINKIIKIIFKRPRITNVNLVIEKTYSYPSGHVMASIILYGYLIYVINNININKYIKIILQTILVIIILLIFISRLYLGAHYFTDCISSIFIGLSILFITIELTEKYIIKK